MTTKKILALIHRPWWLWSVWICARLQCNFSQFPPTASSVSGHVNETKILIRIIGRDTLKCASVHATTTNITVRKKKKWWKCAGVLSFELFPENVFVYVCMYLMVIWIIIDVVRTKANNKKCSKGMKKELEMPWRNVSGQFGNSLMNECNILVSTAASCTRCVHGAAWGVMVPVMTSNRVKQN